MLKVVTDKAGEGMKFELFKPEFQEHSERTKPISLLLDLDVTSSNPAHKHEPG